MEIKTALTGIANIMQHECHGINKRKIAGSYFDALRDVGWMWRRFRMHARKWQREKNWLSAEFNDSVVMLDVAGSGNYFGLNKTAAEIWNILDHPITIDEIVAALRQKFDVSADQCRVAAERSLNKLEEIGAIYVV